MVQHQKNYELQLRFEHMANWNQLSLREINVKFQENLVVVVSYLCIISPDFH